MAVIDEEAVEDGRGKDWDGAGAMIRGFA